MSAVPQGVLHDAAPLEVAECDRTGVRLCPGAQRHHSRHHLRIKRGHCERTHTTQRRSDSGVELQKVEELMKCGQVNIDKPPTLLLVVHIFLPQGSITRQGPDARTQMNKTLGDKLPSKLLWLWSTSIAFLNLQIQFVLIQQVQRFKGYKLDTHGSKLIYVVAPELSDEQQTLLRYALGRGKETRDF